MTLVLYVVPTDLHTYLVRTRQYPIEPGRDIKYCGYYKVTVVREGRACASRYLPSGLRISLCPQLCASMQHRKSADRYLPAAPGATPPPRLPSTKVDERGSAPRKKVPNPHDVQTPKIAAFKPNLPHQRTSIGLKAIAASASIMTSFRAFTPADLNRFAKCNLDPLTETYDIGFYLQYYAKWPSLFQVAVDDKGNILGYSRSP